MIFLINPGANATPLQPNLNFCKRSIEKLINQTVTTYDRTDDAFNNAGIEEKIVPIADLTEEDWDM
jgi:NAD(P)-dependent dehydrogenase (short-subunit alcohol dehydrogenase family)